MQPLSPEERDYTGVRDLLDAIKAAEGESEERRQHLVKALQRENEARDEAVRLREALREVMEENPWRDELWRFTDETERVIDALKEPPRG